MSDIVWEDPAPRTRGVGGTDWSAFVAELKRHPGKWAIARTGGKKTGSLGSTMAALKARGCEGTQRGMPDGTFTLYVRWPEDGVVSYFTRDAIEEIREAGRGHLIPDPDYEAALYYARFGILTDEQDEPVEDDDRDVVEARIDAGDGEDE